MQLKTKRTRPLTTLERQRQVTLELQQQLGVAEVQYPQAQQHHVQLKLEQRLLYGCCAALQLLQQQLSPAGHAFDAAGVTSAGAVCGSLQDQQAALLLQQLQQLPLDDVQQPSTPTTSSSGRGSLSSERQDRKHTPSAVPGRGRASSSSGLRQRQQQPISGSIADDFPFVLGQAPEPAGCQTGFPASNTTPTPPEQQHTPTASAHTATATAAREGSATAKEQSKGCPIVLLQYLLSLPLWPAAADMTLQQLSECYCRCVEDVSLALHLHQQPYKPWDCPASTPLHRLQCTIVRFCWLLMSMLLLHRSDLLAAFTCVNCESLQPWLEVGADPQPNQQPQQQQEPRFQWILAQLKLTDQQQDSIADGAGFFGRLLAAARRDQHQLQAALAHAATPGTASAADQQQQQQWAHLAAAASCSAAGLQHMLGHERLEQQLQRAAAHAQGSAAADGCTVPSRWLPEL